MRQQEKYTSATFKSARALRNKLQGWDVLGSWEDFFSEHTDFLSSEVPKNEVVLSCMNSFATMLETRLNGQDPALVGVTMLQLAKFCVGHSAVVVGDCWTSDYLSCPVQSVGRAVLKFCSVDMSEVPLLPVTGMTVPFLFKTTPQSTVFLDAQAKLLCPIAGAVFLQKLVDSHNKQPGQSSKKRARAPDLSAAEAPAKKPKAKGKSKAKAKAQAQALPQLEPDTVATLEADVVYAIGASAADEADQAEGAAIPAGARQRLWLDDLLAALTKCRSFCKRSGKIEGQEAIVLGSCVARGLEFAFTGSIKLRKVLKEWSKAPLSGLGSSSRSQS